MSSTRPSSLSAYTARVFIIIPDSPDSLILYRRKKICPPGTRCGSLFVFKLVNNSNEYHKSLFRVLFPFVRRPSYLESQTNCFELQRSPKDIYCVAFLVCSALKVKSLNTKAKFWFFPLMFYFANSSSNTRRAPGRVLNSPPLLVFKQPTAVD